VSEQVSILDAAITYAQLGWSVIPLRWLEKGACSCKRSTCGFSAGKHPFWDNWPERASSDADIARGWWASSPQANVGIATGARSGIFVVDVDIDKGGADSLAGLQREHGRLPVTVEAVTGSGGRHLFFKHPAFTVRNIKPAPGIDIRGDGGQVVAAPSLHRSGKRYAWKKGHEPGRLELAEAPEWLLNLLREEAKPAAPAKPRPVPAPSTRALERARKYLARMPPAISGQGGHDALWAAAQTLVRGFNLSEGEAYDLLASDYNQRCEPPWEEKDLRHKIADAIAKSSLPWSYLLDAEKPDRLTPPPAAPGAPERPEIRISTEQLDVNDQAVKALSSDKSVYQRTGILVHVVRDSSGGDERGIEHPPDAPIIGQLPIAVLRERLSAAALWKKYVKSEGGWIAAHPPDWSVSAVHARGTWPNVRRLKTVVESPVLRPDGTILETPGYDPKTELLFEPTAKYLPVLLRPDRRQALSAIAELDEVVADFPFAKPEHRSAWFAGVLTPFARHSFFGPVPLTLVDANVKSAGKTLLIDVASLIATGRTMARMSYPKDDDEMKKLIVAILVAGYPLALIDNVVGVLGGQVLDLLLTGTEFQGRLLGTNLAPMLPALTCWYATGNNVVLNGDTTRRTLHVRLDCEVEDPSTRSHFRHPDLRDFVRRNRPRLVRAALTILRAYFAAGKPDMKLRYWGSYEGWSSVVRAALVWAGLPDPEKTREELTESSDLEALALEQLIAGWEELDPMRSGYTVRDMLRRLEEKPDAYSTLREALDELCPAVNGKPRSSKTVGRALLRLRSRVVGGLCIDQGAPDRTRVATWKVRAARAAPSAGFEGFAGSVQPELVGAIFTDPEVLRLAPLNEKNPSNPANPADNSLIRKDV
jgi:hypothetical protein